MGKADNEQVITKTVSAMREEKGNELFGMIPGWFHLILGFGEVIFMLIIEERIGASLRKESAERKNDVTEEIMCEGSEWRKA